MDKRFVLLGASDNVLVCCKPLLANEQVEIDGTTQFVSVDIEVGHKIARYDIAQGEKIIKYGAPIGSSTQMINKGDHVHMHNMKSDYIASHTRNSRIEGE